MIIPDFSQGPGTVSRGTYLRISDPHQNPSILSFSTDNLQRRLSSRPHTTYNIITNVRVDDEIYRPQRGWNSIIAECTRVVDENGHANVKRPATLFVATRADFWSR